MQAPLSFVIRTNVLAIVALNNTWLDPEFLIQPRLIEFTSPNEPGFFATPTPRSANQTPLNAPTPIVAASEPRGFKTAPFSVTLTSAVPNVEIRYTLDGRVPQANSPLYTGPLPINATTTLRAAVVDPESVQQNVTTVTWSTRTWERPVSVELIGPLQGSTNEFQFNAGLRNRGSLQPQQQ